MNGEENAAPLLPDEEITGSSREGVETSRRCPG